MAGVQAEVEKEATTPAAPKVCLLTFIISFPPKYIFSIVVLTSG
jgi:hypothetical protein